MELGGMRGCAREVACGVCGRAAVAGRAADAGRALTDQGRTMVMMARILQIMGVPFSFVKTFPSNKKEA